MGRSNQYYSMTEAEEHYFGERVASDGNDQAVLAVYRDLDEGHFTVVDVDDNSELAQFSFSLVDRGNLSREDAMFGATEYMNGYLHGVSEIKEE